MASAGMRSGRHKRRLVNEINVVPYIDVMLVLLVIFMVTAPMITTGVVDVPRAGAAPGAQPDAYVEVAVRERGPIVLRLHDPRGAGTRGGPSERQVDRADRKALAEAIRALRGDHASNAGGKTAATGKAGVTGTGGPTGAGGSVDGPGSDLPVLIAAEKGVRYEAVMDVMAELQRQNVGRIALSVRAP